MENFEYLSDNVKKDIPLYGDTRLGRNENKFILEATLTYNKSTNRSSGSIFGQRFFFTENYRRIT